MILVLILLLLFVGYSIVEYAIHRRHLGRIPVRVQVNGTRGKSSVTRLIAAGLRAAGRRVVAKTTGTSPRFITGDNEESPVRRLGKANIFEQVRLVRRAVALGADALVFENMSLDPQYQEIEARMLLRPTHHVITNVRPDHLDVMGPTVRDVALAFARGVPRRGVLFTTQRDYLHVLSPRGGRGLETVVSDESRVGADQVTGFDHVEHAENVALALDVCERLGVNRDAALVGMQRSRPDPGAMRIYDVTVSGKRLAIVNTLAANDPDSIARLWRMVSPRAAHRVVLVNCRADRTDRSKQLADLVAGFEAAEYVATGGLTRVFLSRARQRGVATTRLHDLGEDRPPSEVFERLGLLAEVETLVFATGNTVGYGDRLMAHFAEKAA